MSTPFLPARPIICLYVRVSRIEPPNTGDRIMTLRAGKLTPDDSVEVATRTRIDPLRKPPSTMSRSSKVKPGGFEVEE